MLRLPVCVLLSVFISAFTWAEPLYVAVASNFNAAMRDIHVAFEKTTGHTLIVSFGSSGKFYAQIKHGAPYQVFLSADQSKPAQLELEGLAATGSRFTYAIGALALWSNQAGNRVVDAEVLRDGNFNKLALANPRLAPYGAAAVEVLSALGLITSTQAKWVQGENIGQTFQFVQTGNAELGFVALSQLLGDTGRDRGSYWIVPEHLHQPIRQDAILLKSAESNPAALALLDFLKTDSAREIMRRYGYRVPANPSTPSP